LLWALFDGARPFSAACGDDDDTDCHGIVARAS
jgi:hypothetical protein